MTVASPARVYFSEVPALPQHDYFDLRLAEYPRCMKRDQYYANHRWLRTIKRKVRLAMANPEYQEAMRQQYLELGAFGKSRYMIGVKPGLSGLTMKRVCECVMGHSPACRALFPNSINETEAANG